MTLSGAGDELTGLERKRRRNVNVCTWINFSSTVTMQMATGPFLDIYMFKISGSNQLVGVVESARGIAQLLAAPLLGILADRFNRYSLVRLQAVLQFIPTALIAIAVALDRYELLYVALPIYGVSTHLGNTVRGALLADNVEEGARRTRVISRNFSMQYVGQATAPLLQILVLLSMGELHSGVEEKWQLSDLRLTLLAGCATYFVAQPMSFLFQAVPPASTALQVAERPLTGNGGNGAQATSEQDSKDDWRQERVLQWCGRGGVRKMWATAIAVEATFFFILLGSGMSTKFYPLFFAREFGLSPFALCLLGAAEPLGVAVLSRLNPNITKRLGRAPTAMLFLCVSPILLLAVTELPWIALVAPIFVVRTATARAYIPLFQAIVATCVPTEHRGKFAAMGAFRMSFFSGSAFVGSWLADKYGSYRPAFLITAAWQAGCIALWIPVLLWLPRGAQDT